MDIQANTAIRFFMRLRQLIASKQPSYKLSGEIEADESYVDGVRKGKRDRGAASKIAVFGLLKRQGKVYTKVIVDASSPLLTTGLSQIPSSIRIVGEHIMHWMYPNSIISISTTANYSQTSKITSTELKTSGTKRKDLTQIQWPPSQKLPLIS